MISNNERMRIRRQMQRRIRDVVAERRRARALESAPEPASESADTTDTSLLTSA
ncbi:MULTISPECIES: hypothetical protein [unclassified Micromonospora]|uniref:hypothetical protein n=1 Tax=unclassified Micromonospora TaxID=2617518 RepID=UPI00140503EA|nr:MULTISPECIES: hypothetical protein [unclassified Micromonospora]